MTFLINVNDCDKPVQVSAAINEKTQLNLSERLPQMSSLTSNLLYKSWSFTEGSYHRNFTGKIFGYLKSGSFLAEGGRTERFDWANKA